MLSTVKCQNNQSDRFSKLTSCDKHANSRPMFCEGEQSLRGCSVVMWFTAAQSPSQTAEKASHTAPM